jgi:hypothetical protein
MQNIVDTPRVVNMKEVLLKALMLFAIRILLFSLYLICLAKTHTHTTHANFDDTSVTNMQPATQVACGQNHVVILTVSVWAKFTCFNYDTLTINRCALLYTILQVQVSTY